MINSGGNELGELAYLYIAYNLFLRAYHFSF